MLHIYLTRHGQNEDNLNGILNGHRDLPLTELWIKQAEDLGEKLKETGIIFSAILSSPLQRAYQTGSIVANILNLPQPEKIDDLIERDFWVLTGEKIADVEKLVWTDCVLKGEKVPYFLDAEGAETFPDLIQRAKKLLSYLEENYSGNILLTTHGDFWKMLYTAYYNLDRKEVLQSFHFWNTEVLLLDKDTDPKHAHLFQIPQENA